MMNIPVIPNSHIVRETDTTRDVQPRRTTSVKLRQDNVSIGDESRLVAKLSSRLKILQTTESPDVTKLKHQITTGTYEPSPEKIAKAMIFGPPSIKF